MTPGKALRETSQSIGADEELADHDTDYLELDVRKLTEARVEVVDSRLALAARGECVGDVREEIAIHIFDDGG